MDAMIVPVDLTGYALFAVVAFICGLAVMRWWDQRACTTCYMAQYTNEGKCPCTCNPPEEGKVKVQHDAL
jgi:hypothetical protein